MKRLDHNHPGGYTLILSKEVLTYDINNIL